jgi:SAM-dependent methyltransferase
MMVLEEKEQVESVREWRDRDHYEPVARQFAADPFRPDDEVLNVLKRMSHQDATWLDVGAGGGRYALPLALVSRGVTAIDPSAAMLDVLRQGMATHGIANIDVVEGKWPDVDHGLTADFTLIAHVGYDVAEIEPFIDGFEAAAANRCVAVMMDGPPGIGFYRLWEAVHGFPRQRLPAMREFLHLLLARGATPGVTVFKRDQPEWSFDDLAAEARRRLWLSEGSDKDRRLQALLREELATGPVDTSLPTQLAVIDWKPIRRSTVTGNPSS